MTNVRPYLRPVVAVAIAVVALVGLVACHTGSSEGAPSAQVDHQRAGLAVNNVTEIGYQLAEIGILQWNKTSADAPTSQDAGLSETSVGIIGPGPNAIPVSKVIFNPAAALTQSDTQNAIISVYKRNAPDGGGGTTQTLLASAKTFTVADGGTGSWSPFTAVNFTVVAGAYVSPGDMITVAITKNGTTGVSVPQGELALFTTIQ